ncbi:mRNA splicing factor, thioredoxin-like U5 snRNP [Artemisia annua]|uniref:mRNA splicing factor, thioredoxin-like U5 snRNP n=1 Tax=Artemisia annua TaxID=35608 RepID=A0A2U1KMT7_ARTAN|nr:mRNA splicing factor, thioredoxin-like U5 snRNP [Artemisia annua]
MSQLLTTLTKKQQVDTLIRDTIDKLLVLRFGTSSDSVSLQLDDILAKAEVDVSKFAKIALVDVDSEEIQVYLKYFDITFIPSVVFFFNAHHMKMDSGTRDCYTNDIGFHIKLLRAYVTKSADHTKWIGAFHRKQDFIDVVELAKAEVDVSKFAKIALVDVDSEEIQVYLKYFDITFIPSVVFFFNAHHMKMDSGTRDCYTNDYDHTKWIGAFHRKQDFIDVVEEIFRGAMKGKLIVNCPLPPERIPKFQLLYKDV